MSKKKKTPGEEAANYMRDVLGPTLPPPTGKLGAQEFQTILEAEVKGERGVVTWIGVATMEIVFPNRKQDQNVKVVVHMDYDFLQLERR